MGTLIGIFSVLVGGSVGSEDEDGDVEEEGEGVVVFFLRLKSWGKSPLWGDGSLE